MKGIVLAGGTGSRLWPITKSVSKQLLPVYDKPMIYYPISTLMLAGVRDILIITTPHDAPSFQNLLGDGSDFGVHFYYSVQDKPEGIAQALIIGETFLEGDSCLLILGDNIFHGVGLGMELAKTIPNIGAHIFTYEVANPSDYGVLELDNTRKPKNITEKPKVHISNLAITGLYYLDKQAVDFAKNLKPSARGELEITSLLEQYLIRNELTYTRLTRGAAWLDTGNPNSLNEAAAFIRLIEERTGLKIACLEEIALIQNWISIDTLKSTIEKSPNSSYFNYLRNILEFST